MSKVRAGVTSALLCLWLSSPVTAAVQLVPVVPTGLSSPVFVGHAGDGTNRLFIEEQAGFVYVLQPGSSTPTLFLDIHTKVLSGGERGLLGLAFHPAYRTNGRFYVFYTRDGDGAIVIAEYQVSSVDSNVAGATEKILLTIPHPTFGNHNGGMLAFGPDGYLYIGVGDGGSGNDPPSNAQNINVLLGKILRIDVDPVGGLGPYGVPSTNPYAGSIPGRDEIFATGLRNPWRLSFDRGTGQQWVADVGQGAFEEVNTPVPAGANFGWRVYEGSICTGLDPSLCNQASYTFPVAGYSHAGGRCSITGGYVYRGLAGSLPQGAYVYADYCTGEIFSWDGIAQLLVLDTPLNISSLGEDEAGELYVVGLNGSISRIAAVAPPCEFSLIPASQTFGSGGGSGGIAVSAPRGCSYTASTTTPWIHLTGQSDGSENMVRVRFNVGYFVDTHSGQGERTGSITISGQTFVVRQNGANAGSGSRRILGAPVPGVRKR